MDWREAVRAAFDDLSKRRVGQATPAVKSWNCEVLGACCIRGDWVFFVRSLNPKRLFIEVVPYDATFAISHTVHDGPIENEEAEQEAWKELSRRFVADRGWIVNEADMPTFVYDGETAWNADVARYLRADLQYGRFRTVSLGS